MVLYFTGTGNNKYVAQRITDALGDMLFCMNDCIRICDTSAVEAGERIVIVTPTYAWRIPRIVRDWLIKTELCGVKPDMVHHDLRQRNGSTGKYNQTLCHL